MPIDRTTFLRAGGAVVDDSSTVITFTGTLPAFEPPQFSPPSATLVNGSVTVSAVSTLASYDLAQPGTVAWVLFSADKSYAEVMMPGLQGTDVLGQSRDVYPLARRVMLTAYSGTGICE